MKATKETLATGALVLTLLGYVYDLAQRVAALEATQHYLHGQIDVPK
jgi:hypothetical protein